MGMGGGLVTRWKAWERPPLPGPTAVLNEKRKKFYIKTVMHEIYVNKARKLPTS